MSKLKQLFETAHRARGAERDALVADLMEYSQESIHRVAREHFELYGNEDRLRLAFIVAPQSPIPDRLREAAASYKVEVLRDIWNESHNRGSAGDDRILLGEFDDSEIEAAAFFHELGHIVGSRTFPHTHSMSTMSLEGMAWEVGFSLAAQHGLSWGYNHPVTQWARKQYASYLTGDHRDELPRLS